MCLPSVALLVIGATPLRLEDSEELCAQLLRVDGACEDQWIQRKCQGECPAGHATNSLPDSCRIVLPRAATLGALDAASCSDLTSARSLNNHSFRAHFLNGILQTHQDIELRAGHRLERVLGHGFEGRAVTTANLHAQRSQLALDEVGEPPPFHPLYVSYAPWGGIGSQRSGLIATLELAERLDAKMIAEPTAMAVFDRAHFIQVGNDLMSTPDSVICADRESVVYHHGCAVVGYYGDKKMIQVIAPGMVFDLPLDGEAAIPALLGHIQCPWGRQLDGDVKKRALEVFRPLVEHVRKARIQAMYQKQHASRHTVQWYDLTALVLTEMSDSLLEFFENCAALIGHHVKCIILNLVGFDGMIGVPHAENQNHDLPLTPKNAIWSKWLPTFAGNNHLRKIVDSIGSILRLLAQQNSHAHVVCMHMRGSSCSNLVFDELSDKAPPVIKLAYAYLMSHLSAAPIHGGLSLIDADSLHEFLEESQNIALVQAVSEFVRCVVGLFNDAFIAFCRRFNFL